VSLSQPLPGWGRRHCPEPLPNTPALGLGKRVPHLEPLGLEPSGLRSLGPEAAHRPLPIFSPARTDTPRPTDTSAPDPEAAALSAFPPPPAQARQGARGCCQKPALLASRAPATPSESLLPPTHAEKAAAKAPLRPSEPDPAAADAPTASLTPAPAAAARAPPRTEEPASRNRSAPSTLQPRLFRHPPKKPRQLLVQSPLQPPLDPSPKSLARGPQRGASPRLGTEAALCRTRVLTGSSEPWLLGRGCPCSGRVLSPRTSSLSFLSSGGSPDLFSHLPRVPPHGTAQGTPAMEAPAGLVRVGWQRFEREVSAPRTELGVACKTASKLPPQLLQASLHRSPRGLLSMPKRFRATRGVCPA
jgi:hypothetical protein